LPLGIVDEALSLLPGLADGDSWIFGLTNIVAFLGLFAVLFLESGTPGPNRSGDDPRLAEHYA
jgi:hypothetical protein